MKATAKGNIKYNNVWFHAGDVLEIAEKDIASFGNLIAVKREEKPKPVEIRKPKAKVSRESGE